MKSLLPLVFLCLCLEVCTADDLKSADVKKMLPGFCFAGSRVDEDAPGGFGPSDNNPQKIDKKLGAPGVVSLVAVPEVVVPFGSYRGFSLFLINRTGGEVAFEAADSRLPITREALDPKGRWRPIEFLPSSWCGNSFHRVFLPKNEAWVFTVPEYTGSRETRMRFALETKPPIYSNEFAGKINPSQFKVVKDE